MVRWLRVRASTVQSLVGELGPHMPSEGEGRGGEEEQREGGKTKGRRKEGRKQCGEMETVSWKSDKLWDLTWFQFELCPCLVGWNLECSFKLSEASDPSSGEMMIKYSP